MKYQTTIGVDPGTSKEAKTQTLESMTPEQQRIEAARNAGWTHIRTERSYADGIPPGCPAPHPFGAHNYQELPAEWDGLCCHCGNEVVEIRPGKHQCDSCENAGGMARELATMTDQRDAAMQCHEWCRKDRKRIIKELIKVTEQRDRLAEALIKACANPTTGNWYREAQDALATLNQLNL
jgi:hypothetical protein